MSLKRSSAVVIAVTMQRLIEDATRYWPKEQELVLEALRRSKTSLNGTSAAELREYIADLNQDQFQGVLNNVKGMYHELLFVNEENSDGDEILAEYLRQPITLGPMSSLLLTAKLSERFS